MRYHLIVPVTQADGGIKRQPVAEIDMPQPVDVEGPLGVRWLHTGEMTTYGGFGEFQTAYDRYAAAERWGMLGVLVEVQKPYGHLTVTFHLIDIPLTALKATGLQRATTRADLGSMEAWRIKFFGQAETAEALYIPSIRRLGIATWGVEARWLTVRSVVNGVERFLSDSDSWELTL